jgi:hypothetical protein
LVFIVSNSEKEFTAPLPKFITAEASFVKAVTKTPTPAADAKLFILNLLKRPSSVFVFFST